jgi:hypothetical protein
MLGQVREDHRALLALVDELRDHIKGTFMGSREGFDVVDVDRYFSARTVLENIVQTYDAEVFRACFEERLSNRSVSVGERS